MKKYLIFIAIMTSSLNFGACEQEYDPFGMQTIETVQVQQIVEHCNSGQSEETITVNVKEIDSAINNSNCTELMVEVAQMAVNEAFQNAVDKAMNPETITKKKVSKILESHFDSMMVECLMEKL